MRPQTLLSEGFLQFYKKTQKKVEIYFLESTIVIFNNLTLKDNAKRNSNHRMHGSPQRRQVAFALSDLAQSA